MSAGGVLDGNFLIQMATSLNQCICALLRTRWILVQNILVSIIKQIEMLQNTAFTLKSKILFLPALGQYFAKFFD